MINIDLEKMTTRYLFWGVLSLLALSCTTKIEEPYENGPLELTFQASMADDPDTRTVLREDRMSIWWSPRDTIKITCGEFSSGVFISNNSEPTDRAVFSGTLYGATGTIDNENTKVGFMAVYPYRLAREQWGTNVINVFLPREQIAADNTFARGMFPAVAASTNLNLSFYNICGGVVFTVQGNDVKTVTLTGNKNECIAGLGAVSLSFSGGTPSTTIQDNQFTSIILKAPNGRTFTPGVRYFISVFPQRFEQGLTLTFFKASSKTEVSWSKPATIKRSRFLVIENADAGAGEYEYAVPEEAYNDMDNLYYCFMRNVASNCWAFIYSPQRFLFNYCGDDVHAGGDSYGDNDFSAALNEFRYDAGNDLVLKTYSGLYAVIRQSNSFLKKFEEDLPKFVGPARVFRAYAQMMLAIGWGTPPLEDHVLTSDELPSNGNLTREQILEWCARECEAAIPYLDERESPQDKEGAYKITKGFAQAVAGKAYLFAGNYRKAKELLGDVIHSGKYELIPGTRFWENFHIEGDGNEEKIFEPNIEYPSSYSYMDITTWMEGNTLNWRSDHFVQPPQYGYTGVVEGWGYLGVSENFAESFVANDGEDSYRLKSSIIHIDDVIGGSMYGNSTLDGMTKEEKLASSAVGITQKGLYGQSFWLPFKQLIKGTDTNRSTGSNTRWNNYTIMRYAEVLLLYAEACLQTGDTNEALRVINQIQRRAGSRTISTTVDMDVLKREKGFELWFEGCRWADLVRWGDTDGVEKAGQSVPVLYDKFFRAPQQYDENVTWENGEEANSRFYLVSTHYAKDGGQQIGYVAGKHNLFPIPASELQKNPNLVQNPGW